MSPFPPEGAAPERLTPSLRKIFMRDFVVLFVIAVIAAVTVFSLLRTVDPLTQAMPIWMRLLKFTGVLGAFLIYVRVRAIYRLFAEGTEVKGTLRGQKYLAQNHRVTCDYTVAGRSYSMLVTVDCDDPVPGTDGQSVVTLLVDPRDHARAIVRDMFRAGPKSPRQAPPRPIPPAKPKTQPPIKLSARRFAETRSPRQPGGWRRNR